MPCNCVLTHYNTITGIPVISAISGGKKNFAITLKDGTTVDSPPLDLSDAATVTFMVKESDNIGEFIINKEATIVDASAGTITITLTKTDLIQAGMWTGAFLIKDDEGNNLAEYRVWLRVERSIEDMSGNTPVTFAQIRTVMYDRCGDDNPLLNGVEFSDSQILTAMQRPIDEWNETPPNVGIFTSVTFPYANAWINGIVGNLLQMAALRYIRNDLAYSAGSTQVQDMNKGPAYAKLSEDFLKQWGTWLAAKKRELNIEQGWGSVSIGAFNGRRRY